MPDVRPYTADDEGAWLRCRVLGFLGTAYFDDVLTTKPKHPSAVELVAVDDTGLVGLIDVAYDADAATIETIAVTPGRFRSGVGSALLDGARQLLPQEVRTLDAWTRDDAQAMGWYEAMGFVETFRYLHVYASSDEEAARAVPSPGEGLTPVRGFFHARIEAEDAVRASFARVHVCRRYELALGGR